MKKVPLLTQTQTSNDNIDNKLYNIRIYKADVKSLLTILAISVPTYFGIIKPINETANLSRVAGMQEAKSKYLMVRDSLEAEYKREIAPIDAKYAPQIDSLDMTYKITADSILEAYRNSKISGSE